VVKTGARDESPQIAGVSHFLEHMVFKGTPSRSAEDVNREFDAMGAENNAYTSKENTVFWAAVLPEFTGRALGLLADILRPSLREEDFDMEKQVIIEEIRMYEDQPPFGADEKCEAWHFAPHPLGQSVLGTVDSVGGLSVEAMRTYFERRYSPTNIVLAAAGRVDWDELVASAESCTRQWTAYAADRNVASGPRQPGFFVLHKPQAAQQYVVQLAAAPSTGKNGDGPARTRYAADLATTMLGDSTGSRLYWELLDTGEADQAAVYFTEYQGAGVFWTSLSGRPENASSNVQRLHDIFRGVEERGFTPEELLQARSKSKSRVVLAAERPARRLFHLAGNWVHREEYQNVADELAAYDAVTLDDVNAVVRDFPLTVNTTVTIGPLESVSQPR
jgi:predicted Zn-dependent peptidase